MTEIKISLSFKAGDMEFNFTPEYASYDGDPVELATDLMHLVSDINTNPNKTESSEPKKRAKRTKKKSVPKVVSHEQEVEEEPRQEIEGQQALDVEEEPEEEGSTKVIKAPFTTTIDPSESKAASELASFLNE